MDPIDTAAPQPTTLAGLRASGWRSRTVKEELRANLLERLANGAQVFPGVVGYDETVVPGIENAILAGHDLVFLGERGQAKTRMARLLVGLLDPWLPVVRGGELNDDPTAPISPAARAIVERDGDATMIDWLPRDRRYAEKLATPDITIADLIGEVDPIKVAEGRYLSDELTLHYGLIPRANRGIVAINELPDLAERIQVGLLNILEERDVQIRGFVVRLPARPVHGRLGQPGGLHLARSDHHAAQGSSRITDPDALPTHARARDGYRPPGEAPLPDRGWRARRGRARVHGGAGRRADPPGPPLGRDQPAFRGQRARLGGELRGARGRRAQARRPTRRAGRCAPRVRSRRGRRVDGRQGRARDGRRRVARGADRRAAHHQGAPHDVQPARSVEELEGVVEAFEDGFTVETGDRTPSREYVAWMREVPGLSMAVDRLGAYDVTDGSEEPAVIASAVEFLLEGLHLARRLNKDRIPGGTVYHR